MVQPREPFSPSYQEKSRVTLQVTLQVDFDCKNAYPLGNPNKYSSPKGFGYAKHPVDVQPGGLPNGMSISASDSYIEANSSNTLLKTSFFSFLVNLCQLGY
jgi:hypothetical protein